MGKFISIEGTTNWNSWAAPKDQKTEKYVINEDDIMRVGADKYGLAELLLRSPNEYGKTVFLHTLQSFDDVVRALGKSVALVSRADLSTMEVDNMDTF